MSDFDDIRQARLRADAFIEGKMTDCPECKGRGKIMLFSHEHTCNNCGGSGKVTKEDDNNDSIYIGCGF